ncbi:MAG: type V CRISPR-associated protein Cas12b [Alicyclobacillus shizuokensis]|nr:type V CRISPR-associated protein Cas12b [Alicyclobacillus shizuokensis]
MDALGLRPLFVVFTETYKSGVDWKPLGKSQGVRTWDRDMFQQALERLMSWESWNRRVGEEYARLFQQKMKFEQEHFAEQSHLGELARALEADMRAASQGFEAKRGTAHQITRRALRGADRVFETWRRLPEDALFSQYDEVIRQVQAEKRRDFGSHDLFAKLAEPKYQPLWRADETFLTRYALYNGVLRDLEEAKQFATFTLPDACVNPIWTRFESSQGSNLHKYEFLFDHLGPGRHAVRFQRLLVVESEGAKEKDSVVVPVAPSGQLDKLVPREEEKSSVALHLHDTAQPDGFMAEWAGAKLQYERSTLARKARRDKQGMRLWRRQPSTLMSAVQMLEDAKQAGDVYLNISVRVKSPSEVRGQRRPPYAALFRIDDKQRRVTVNYNKLSAYLEEHPDKQIPGALGLLFGLRVMSVDLGLRTSASISVFRVAKREEVEALGDGHPPHYYPIHGTDDLVAVHERSHLIQMPGETETKQLRKLREERQAALRPLFAQLAVLRLLVRCGAADERIRTRSWQRLTKQGREFAKRLTPSWREALESELTRLEAYYGRVPDDEWSRLVDKTVTALWCRMGKQVRDWRKQVKSGAKVKVKRYQLDVVGGNSLAQIDYLEQQYRFLRRWSFFARASGLVVRADRDSHFAVALRQHIENAKRDRLKKLADRILMEALGYVYEASGPREGQWTAQHPPCQLIILEELSAYRFSDDRPPSENSKLMAWGHRGILEELVNQAQVHDVLVGTVYAAFSSRFDARTGAPGVRCRRVPARFVGATVDDSLPLWLTEFLDKHRLDKNLLRPDDVIPTGEGEFLVSPCGEEAARVRQVHADINAAQNLQRRLWQNFDITELRLRCDVKMGGEGTVLVPRVNNARAKQLFGKKVLVSQDGVTFFERSQTGGKPHSEKQTDLTDKELELIAEADEARAKSVVLFRDPSGHIGKGHWIRQREFWSLVKQRIESHAAATIRVRGVGSSLD